MFRRTVIKNVQGAGQALRLSGHGRPIPDLGWFDGSLFAAYPRAIAEGMGPAASQRVPGTMQTCIVNLPTVSAALMGAARSRVAREENAA
jgi:hypothetical protein